MSCVCFFSLRKMLVCKVGGICAVVRCIQISLASLIDHARHLADYYQVHMPPEQNVEKAWNWASFVRAKYREILL